MPTTLMPRLQRQRVVAQVGAIAERLAGWTREQGSVLARLSPTVQDMVVRAVEAMRPALQQAASRIHDRPEHVAARRRTAELVETREKLLTLRMTEFGHVQRWGVIRVDAARERQWAEQAQAEESRQRAAIGAMTDAEVRKTLRREDVMQRWLERQQRREVRVRGPSPSPRP